VRMGMIHQVLLQLAEDRISLSDIVLVLEAVINNAPSRKTPDDLTDAVREDLGHLVCARYQDEQGSLRVLALQPQLEGKLRESLTDGQVALAPAALEKFIAAVGDKWRGCRTDRTPVALLTHHSLRRPLKKLLRRALPNLGFVAYREVPADMLVSPAALIRVEEPFEVVGTAHPPEPAGARRVVTAAA
jgi:flagellar biosynthesis protein FlhA